MKNSITGYFEPKLIRSLVCNRYCDDDCECRTDIGECYRLCYQGVGLKRTFSIVDVKGEVLAYSERMCTTGLSLYFDPSLRFVSTLTGCEIASRTGFWRRVVSIGKNEVAVRQYGGKWFRIVTECPYFQFVAQLGKRRINFTIKDPDVLIESLCIGYLFYITESSYTTVTL